MYFPSFFWPCIILSLRALLSALSIWKFVPSDFATGLAKDLNIFMIIWTEEHCLLKLFLVFILVLLQNSLFLSRFLLIFKTLFSKIIKRYQVSLIPSRIISFHINTRIPKKFVFIHTVISPQINLIFDISVHVRVDVCCVKIQKRRKTQ